MPDGNGTLWPGRGHVAIFIRCLHLLDLDLLPDWPGLGEQTFLARVSQQNMHARTKGVEWSLYRLFELYSPAEARDKLRPFFPPMTSLQSVNLRAALLRVLTELKKTGVLPRDVVLRKTMLDECKGERFEELLSSFAIVVMKKGLNQPNARLTFPEHVPKTDNVQELQLLPLVLACRHSIQKVLRQRQHIRQQTTARHEKLDRLSESLSQRKAEVIGQNLFVNTERRGSAVELLRGEWTGDSRWVNTILYEGKPRRDAHESSSKIVQKSRSDETSATTDGLLADLDRRLLLQRERLDRLRTFERSLPIRDTKDAVNIQSDTPFTRTSFPFIEHQSIKIGSRASKDFPEAALELHGAFVALRDSLSRDLSTPARLRPRSIATPAGLSKSPLSRCGVQTPRYPPIQEHAEPVKYTTRPEQGSSEKVEQLAPLPQGALPSGDDSSSDQVDSEFSWLDETRQSHSDLLPRSQLMGVSNHETLIDRTRKSMAALFTSDIELSTNDPEIAEVVSGVSANNEPQSKITLQEQSDRRGTLLERTRQSMAVTSGRPQVTLVKPRSKGNRVSQLHPINQFETPEKPVQQQSILSPSSNGSTPREKLFSEDAEYNSVFKSRPKIAQSPVLSPDRSAVEDSILAREITILDIGNDEVENSSD